LDNKRYSEKNERRLICMKVERIIQKTTHFPSPGNKEVVVRFIPENGPDRKKLKNLEKAIEKIPDLLVQDVNMVICSIDKNIHRFEIYIQI
jgi:hypothetical protein